MTLARVLVEDHQQLQRLPPFGRVEEEVVGPDVPAVGRARRQCRRSPCPALARPAARPAQPRPPPDPPNPLAADGLALPAQQRRDAAVAIARVLAGEREDERPPP